MVKLYIKWSNRHEILNISATPPIGVSKISVLPESGWLTTFSEPSEKLNYSTFDGTLDDVWILRNCNRSEITLFVGNYKKMISHLTSDSQLSQYFP